MHNPSSTQVAHKGEVSLGLGVILAIVSSIFLILGPLLILGSFVSVLLWQQEFGLGDIIIGLRVIIGETAFTLFGFFLKNMIGLFSNVRSKESGYLAQIAQEISCILNRGNPDDTTLYSVPYLVFGHDHHANFLRLSTNVGNLPQWYVNTSTWVQAYTGEVRYRYEDESHSVFLKIIHSPDTTGQGKTPDLLRWDHQIGRPARLKHLVKLNHLPERPQQTSILSIID